MRTAFATAALLALLSVPSTVPAQIEYAPYVSAADAQVIAGQAGLAVIYRLRLDEGVWKIEGRDGNGQYVYMRIDPRTGQVIRLERYW
jgi:Peptidase propeptide and YPEB domain